MLRLMLQKLLYKKWLIISLLIGNILLVAIAASYPMYRDASLQKMMITEFDNYMESYKMYPSQISLEHSMDNEKQVNDFWEMEKKSNTICDELDLTMDKKVTEYGIPNVNCIPTESRDIENSAKVVNLISMSDFKEHSTILAGSEFSDSLSKEGYIDVVVSQQTFQFKDLLIGDTFNCDGMKGKDGKAIKLRVVGIFTVNYESNSYWKIDPSSYMNEFFISQDIFKSEFLYDKGFHNAIDGQWRIDFDYTKVQPEQVDKLIKETESRMTVGVKKYKSFEESGYLHVLNNYKSKLNKAQSTLFLLIIPLFVLLCAFIFMISSQILSLEDNEISLFKSRGASRKQIFGLYLLQSACMAGGSFVLGLPLASILCKVLGSANAFLEFINRTSLPIKYTKSALLYSLGAMIVSILITILPVLKNSALSIVNLKQKKARKQKKLWQKLYLDVVILAISLYGYYSFDQNKSDLLSRVIEGKSIDPLLFLSSSLFILGATLFTLRLQPLLVKLIYRIGKKRWKPSNYAAFLQIIRTGNKQYFIMVFMILTIALGIFNSTIARTIVLNAEKNAEYSTGAELTFEENWKQKDSPSSGGEDSEGEWIEPEYSTYSQLPEVKASAKVFRMTEINVDSTAKVTSQIMAINTKEFGETAYLPEGLNKVLFNEYLNALSTNVEAVLLSSNYKTKHGLKIGDIININAGNRPSLACVVYGFVDYWPGYSPTHVEINEDNSNKVVDDYLVIAHLSRVQQIWGKEPYEIWMKLKGADTNFFYDYIKKNEISVSSIKDRKQAVLGIRKDSVFQGTNGILTMSFIVILVLCSIGYLIYWILSISGRELLFGVFRAMGMSKREIIHMLINEQLFTGGLAIVLGGGIGVLASKLYIPMIQISYSGDNQVLPLEIMTKSSDMVRLFVIVALVFVVCMMVLASLVKKLKIAQALKLGED